MKTRLRSIIERVLTYGLIVLSIAALVYFFSSVNTKQKKEIAQKNDELAGIKQKLSVAKNDYINRCKQIDKITAELREKKQEVIEKFEKLLEKATNYTVFIEQVQRKAKSLDIHIQNSHYNPPAPAAGVGSSYLEFKFDLRIIGPYNKVKQFLWELENSLGRLVKIVQIELLPPLNDETGNMSLKLTLATFFKS